ncbi:2'-5' RNA ligase [Stackebrandtia nassauensis DSM 44728]|uniref:RNA 2',3'-cyclic phosphodiesterase n=1 Tax=Stackebrandtia nassauensis (strain DSM 44728 / CIP 108903 / NRRL B-16338 / NBRC 102104 / LLR-40K-21) TaxID=446470 RepID=D3PZ48_STANL|nr:2'-5' RNA ligase [Stackebrandtia nassauensis DSM 44728]
MGLRPSDAALADLAGYLPRIGLDGARPTGRQTWHLTLAFIGELDDRRVEDVSAALTALSRTTAGFALRLAGGTVLGRTSTALCVGTDGDTTALTALAERVRTGLRRSGVPFDERPFKPHLTVARPKDLSPAEVQAKVDALGGYNGPSWRAEKLVLYRSHPGPPVRYEALERFPLRG